MVLAFGMQDGAGLYIYDGTATLNSCNVFSNVAHVRLPHAPALNCPPAPRWNVTRVLAFLCSTKAVGSTSLAA